MASAATPTISIGPSACAVPRYSVNTRQIGLPPPTSVRANASLARGRVMVPSVTSTRRDGARTGKLRSNRRLTIEKIAVLAAMPSASDRIATALNSAVIGRLKE
jgi:hypothetical protein